MKKGLFAILTAGFYLSLCLVKVPVLASNAPNGALLTVEDVAKITGVRGLTMVPKDPAKRMNGDMNFVRPDGVKILSVTIETINLKEFAKIKTTDSFKNTFRGPVKGIGDEAYDGPPKMEPFILSVLKGTHWMTISTSFDMNKGMKLYLTQDQLKKIAEIIIKNGKW